MNASAASKAVSMTASQVGGVNLLSLAASALASSILASRPIRWFALVPNASKGGGCHEVSAAGKPIGAAYPPIDPSSPPFGKGKNPRLKLDGTVVTDADGAAQRIIVDTLRSVSPEIRIVGEESHEDERGDDATREERPWENSDDDPHKILEAVREEISDRIRTKGIGNSEIEPVLEIDPSRVSVFIDPLDGTKNYASGKYDSVTTLIAIVVDNRPCFGVICKPFGQAGEPTLLDSGCFAVYGGTLLNGAYIAGGGECRRDRPSQEGEILTDEQGDTIKPTKFKAVISKSRAGGIVSKCLGAMHDRGLLEKDPLHISGAGEKTLRLVTGSKNESLWFFPKPGTSLWDVAAADALLTAIGGKLTDKNGNEIDYSKSRNDAGNDNGIVASNNADLHEECIRIFDEGGWESENPP